MGELYDHFTLDERCTMAQLRQAGQSLRQIAATLDRSPSSVSRELKRNHGAHVGYKPDYAQEQATARRWTGSPLERNAELRGLALGGLQRGWSPEQVARWLHQQKTPATISHETIYRFIYAQIRRTNDDARRHSPPRAEHKRPTDKLGMRPFNNDPHSPWQKSAMETAIGRMRRPLPRKTNLNTIDHHPLTAAVAAYNNTPRKCLGFKSPAQAFLSQLLHFKCESTPSLRSG